MTEEVKDPNEVQSINIDGTPHDIDSLTELAKFYVSQLQDLANRNLAGLSLRLLK